MFGGARTEGNRGERNRPKNCRTAVICSLREKQQQQQLHGTSNSTIRMDNFEFIFEETWLRWTPTAEYRTHVANQVVSKHNNFDPSLHSRIHCENIDKKYLKSEIKILYITEKERKYVVSISILHN